MRSFIVAIATVILLASCTNHGDKVVVGNIEVYFKKGITKEEAEKTAQLLHASQQKESSAKEKSLQLTKSGDTINLRMVVPDEKMNQIPEESFLALSNIVSETVFGGKPVNMDLTDNKFKTKQTIHFRHYDYAKETEDEFGNRLTSGNVELFNKNISTEEAQRLVDFLSRYVGKTDGISFQISRPENGYYTLNMVSDEKSANSLAIKELNDFSRTISDSVFNGAPLVLNMVDDDMNPIRTYKYNTQEREATDTMPVR